MEIAPLNVSNVSNVSIMFEPSGSKFPNASIGTATSWESSAESQEWRRHSAAEGRDFKSQDNICAQSEAEEAEGNMRQSGSKAEYLGIL